MATQNITSCKTFEAGSDLSASQFHFVTLASDGQIDLTGDGAIAHGVLQNDPNAAGAAAEVATMHGDIMKVEAGGAVTVGANVASNAAGEAVVATTGEAIMGIALDAGSDGQRISILFGYRGAAA